MTLQQAWDDQGDNWIRFASNTMSDASFWSYHLPAFLNVLPPPTGRHSRVPPFLHIRAVRS